jgi:hypothetical protein
MHDAGISGQIYAVHESAPGLIVIFRRHPNLWAGYSCVAPLYSGFAQ